MKALGFTFFVLLLVSCSPAAQADQNVVVTRLTETILATLEICIIPLAIVLIPLLWAFTGLLIRRWQFSNLIFREIEELGPFPKKKVDAIKQPDDTRSWRNHHTSKRFLHQEILEKPTENRDFILSLPPALVYHVTQLWESKDDADQWLFMLCEIREDVPDWIPEWSSEKKKELAKVIINWYKLIKEYQYHPDIGEETKTRILELKR